MRPPLPGKVIRLYFPTSPETVSKVQFGASAQRPSFPRQQKNTTRGGND